jgi:hypothetical protein
MSTDIKCPKCGGHFSSQDNYQNHLPCGDSSVLGGAGDTYLGKSESASTEGGTGSN